jgi:hypothetical protein
MRTIIPNAPMVANEGARLYLWPGHTEPAQRHRADASEPVGKILYHIKNKRWTAIVNQIDDKATS